MKKLAKDKINFDLSLHKNINPKRILRKKSSHSTQNNTVDNCTTDAQEMLRQERIINAIIDNDESCWYSNTQYIKKRNYSTFDGRQTFNIPKYLITEDQYHL